MLTDDQAARIRVAMMAVYDRTLFDLGFVDGGTNSTCATEEGMEALAEYDAAQAASRVEELRRAYIDGLTDSAEGFGQTDAVLEAMWRASVTKRRLEGNL